MDNLIPQELIERALALTGKTMNDMNEIYLSDKESGKSAYRFSWNKFYAYLLSPKFLERMTNRHYGFYTSWGEKHAMARLMGEKIAIHQRWAEEEEKDDDDIDPLFDFLSPYLF